MNRRSFLTQLCALPAAILLPWPKRKPRGSWQESKCLCQQQIQFQKETVLYANNQAAICQASL